MKHTNLLQALGGVRILICGLVSWLSVVAVLASERPNVLLIVSEDNGAELGCYGTPDVRTPRLDQLAAEGCRFANAYVPHAVCSASRAAFLTGLYPFQNGQIGLATHRYSMFRNWDNLPGILKAHGYRTGLMGKLHVNPESAFPFDFRWNESKANSFGTRNVQRVAEVAGEFFRETEQPFFLSLNFSDAHFPILRQQNGLPEKPLSGEDLSGPLPFIGADSPRLRQGTADYYNCMMRLDSGVGMVLDELEEAGKKENTLVLYIGDHGAQFSRGKATCYEGGLRIPMIVRWPGQVAPQTVREELVTTIDILPTVLQATALPARASLPGSSLLPLAAGRDVRWRKYLFAERTAYHSGSFYPQRTLRDERYKVILNLTPDQSNPVAKTYETQRGAFFIYGTNAKEIAAAPKHVQQAYVTWHNPPPVELYDLKEDPWEFRNLSEDPALASVKLRLLTELRKFREHHGDPLLDVEKLEKLAEEHHYVATKVKGGRYGSGKKWKYLTYLQSTEITETNEAGKGSVSGLDEMTIVAFGDSTTAPRSTVEKVYAARLPALLQARGIGAKVINAGVGGSHTGRLADNALHRREHALDRLDEAVRSHEPDVVVVQFGWNDSWIDSGKPEGASRIPLKDFAANLEQITGTLKKDGSKVILMTPNRPDTSLEDWRVARTQQYVDAVRHLAAANSIPLVDVWAEFGRFDAGHGLQSDNLLLDRLHPNDQGHELVARLLADSIGGLNAAKARRPNVLFLSIDDLRPELGCYGQDYVKSPHIDRLASQGVLFERAYCQQPLCNPSRTSLMTGMRPESIGVLGNHVYFRNRDPFIATLPQHFRHHGYRSVGIGKLYHGPFVDEAVCSTWDRLDDPLSWSEPAIRFGPRYYFTDQGIAAARKVFNARNRNAGPDSWQNALLFGPMTEAPAVPDNALYDGKVGDAAVAKLRELKAAGKPFFLGVGFIKPHTPFIAPKKYWDLYDADTIPLARNPDYPETSPEMGFHSSGEIRRYTDQPKRGPFTEENRRRLKHGYLACISHIDAQVGRVLNELERLKLAENTIVVLWGDHGYHLGEQNMWGKVSSFENAARVPLIVRNPKSPGNGRRSHALVELVDLYPTLVDLAGLPAPEQLEGISLRAVLDQPRRPWKNAVFTDQPARGNWDQGGSVVGRSMRTDRYRYTAWVNRTDGSVVARQLFDHDANPLETKNLAAEPKSQDLVRRLHGQLTTGWQGAAGPAMEFAAQNTAAATRISSDPGIRTGFETLPAGPFTKLSEDSGTWEAEAGHAVIHTAHSRSGTQSLRLPGGKDRQVEWTPVMPKAKPDRLGFWFERWTRRTPWEFRVEALVGEQWQTLHHDTSKAVTGSFRNRLSLKLGDRTPTKFRFTCTAPENSGVMIDDLRLGRGEYREPVLTEVLTRDVDGRVEMDLFYNRMNGAANYRIPSLNVTNQGTVLAVCDCRRDRGGDAPNNIDQVVRRSTDNGKTWSEVSTIIDYPGKRTAGDPSLTIDRQTGTIWLCYVYAEEGVGLAGGRNEPGYGQDTFHIHLRRSDDDGLTWSAPIDISRQIKPADWFAIWTAPGNGIQTRDGRLMICFSGRKRLPNGKWTATSNIAYSDDHGKTWGAFKDLGLGTNESQVVELDNGSYMINMRQDGGRARWESISRDRGKTWSKQEQHPALIGPGGCQASILRLTSMSRGDDRNRLLFSNPASTKGRRNMTVRLSYDEGKTWPVGKVIYAGSSAYSSLAVLPDGSIGLFYERDGRRITFTRFTLEWLTDGKDRIVNNGNGQQ